MGGSAACAHGRHLPQRHQPRRASRPRGRVRPVPIGRPPGLAAGRARAHGRRHEPALPHPVPPLWRGPLRERDDHGPRARRRATARPCSWRASVPRRRRAASSSTASIPTTWARRCALLVGEGPRRPRRHELRLPGAQGHEQGRRARPSRSSRGSCGAIVRAAVCAAEPVPVTLKFRIGIDERLHTYLDSGRIAQDEGCAAVGLHARTAAQLYDGQARWEAIARPQARGDARSPSSATATSGKRRTRCA